MIRAFCICVFLILVVVLCTIINPLVICLLWFLSGLLGVLISMFYARIPGRAYHEIIKDAFICSCAGPTFLLGTLLIILTDWMEK